MYTQCIFVKQYRFTSGCLSQIAYATLKNHSTGSLMLKNRMGIFCGELYREMTSPSRKTPNVLAKASWCFCRWSHICSCTEHETVDPNMQTLTQTYGGYLYPCTALICKAKTMEDSFYLQQNMHVLKANK